MSYNNFVLLHACSMVAAVALMVASELLLFAARNGRGGPARMAFRISRLGGALAGVGLVSGIAILLMGGWSLWTPWLLASLALIAAMVVVERRFVRPWQELSAPVLHRDAAGPGIQAVATDPQGLFGRMGVIALFAAIGVLMVVKPGLGVF